jgi:adenylylsulfate kinase
MKSKESHLRSLIKGISWRFLATTDTFLIVILITCLYGNCSFENAIKIGAIEFVLKLLIYYSHERIWQLFTTTSTISKRESLIKTVSWRIVATTITFIIAGAVLNSFNEVALSIALLELISKFILYYLHERFWLKIPFGYINNSIKIKYMNENIIPHQFYVTKKQRNKLNNHASFLIWFTGLSGSGKSTIANALENKLNDNTIHTYLLDGDNVREGLNGDLTFSPEDRSENIRRIAEVSSLLIDAGLVVLSAFVSPYKKDRMMVKSKVKDVNFVEIFIDTPLEECIKRDTKGLYAKAKKGLIKDFTGINAPYEEPENPNLRIDTTKITIDEAVHMILNIIEPKLENL